MLPKFKRISKQICEKNDKTVLRIAQAMRENPELREMPILADALEDNGYTGTELLCHLREPLTHCRCCPALNAILGKDKDFSKLDSFMVNHDRPLEELVKANRLTVHNAVTLSKFFHTENKKGKEETIFKLFHFGKGITTKSATGGMKKEGYRPSNLIEALHYKSLRLWTEESLLVDRAQVVILGSNYTGRLNMIFAPILFFYYPSNFINIELVRSAWAKEYYFLGILEK